MQAILYVAHGTRLEAGINEARNFIQHHIKQINVPIQEMSFIDLASPSIEEGIDSCVKQGATKIAMIPILLLEAGHAKYDLPKAIEHAKEKYPYIDFTYGKPFGVNDNMVDIIIKRINEQQPLDKDASILIVARGSSDDSIRSDFHNIITRLQHKTGIHPIDVCYLAAQTPNLNDGLLKQQNNAAKNVYVVPYLLFTGLLMLHLEKEVNTIKMPNKNFILCHQLGLTEEITELLCKRIADSIKVGGKQHGLPSTHGSVTA